MVTGFFLFLISLFYFQIDKFSEYLLQFNSISSKLIIDSIISSKNIELITIFTSHLFHKDLHHYLLNSIGLISQGIILENYFGKKSNLLYFKVFVYLMFFSSVISTLINYLIFTIFENQSFYISHYSGLSSVLFGLQFIYFYITSRKFYTSLFRVLIYIIYANLFVRDGSFLTNYSGLISGVVVTKVLDL